MRKHEHLPVKPRILVADEMRDLVDVYAFLFTAAGYRVSRAYDGLTAAALAKVTRPDAAILGERMRGLSGVGVLRELRAAGVGTKVIITSGGEEFAGLSRFALAQGASYCVRQPCDSERLLRMAASVLVKKPSGFR